MKLAVVSPEVFPVPPVRGGAVETVIEEISRRLTRWDVHIFGISDPELPDLERSGHRTYYRFRPRLLDRLMLSHWRLPFRNPESPLYYWPYSHWVSRWIRKIQPDAVWLSIRPHFVPAIKTATGRAPVVLSIHNSANLSGGLVWGTRTLDGIAAVTACGSALKQEAAEKRPACRERLHVLHSGVDPDTFVPWWQRPERRDRLRQEFGFGNDPVVLYVGRLVPEKGAHVLLDAFRKATAVTRCGTLVIVGAHTFSTNGTTPYIEDLRRQASSLGARVRFTGYVPFYKIADYFLASDLVAFPSLWAEPFGMVVVEAMATGVPVVAFANGGPAEIIQHGRDGFLVPPEEGAVGFARELGRVISDPILRREIGRAASQTAAARFSWDILARQLDDLLDSVLSHELPRATAEEAGRG